MAQELMVKSKYKVKQWSKNKKMQQLHAQTNFNSNI